MDDGAHFSDVRRDGADRPRALRTTVLLAAVVPPLAVAVRSAWALVEPGTAANRAWTTGLTALLACEGLLLLFGLLAGSLTGPRRMRLDTSGGLAAICGVLLVVVALATRTFELVLMAAVRYAGMIADAWNLDPGSRDVRQRATFGSAIAFVVLLAGTAAPWAPLERAQGAGAFATAYFLVSALLAAWCWATQPAPERDAGAPGLAVTVRPEAIAIEYRGAWHRFYLGLALGSGAVIAAGLAAFSPRFTGAGLAFGAFVGAIGAGILGWSISRATRRAKVTVEAGRLQWEERSLFGYQCGTAAIDSVRNPEVEATARASNGEELACALVIRLEDRGIRFPGFLRRARAEALGRLVAATLKHGGNQAVRGLLSEDADVAALLRSSPAAGLNATPSRHAAD